MCNIGPHKDRYGGRRDRDACISLVIHVTCSVQHVLSPILDGRSNTLSLNIGQLRSSHRAQH